MFFKKLTIDGFKSFGEKTDISFPSGVSVIVGPNGCGKSNVFDSIKWVLGEQRARSLRGGRMADVIFAGTPTRKAAPCSEVTIELSNASGVLPTDEDSLAIQRRLLRTGESEYFMNGAPCRLRDIQRAMLGAGAGADSFAIMQQGKVDRVIHSKPRDRRYIFEEAAGIAKYKAQKEEALRRLARTDEDLNRVRDLMTEVARNTSKLRKQAERAREHIRLTQELRKREMVLLALRRSEIEAEREAAEAMCFDLRDQVSGFDQQIEELTELNESRRGELEELAALLDSLQAERDAALEAKTEASAKLSSLDERLEHIAERRKRLRIEIESEDARGDARDEERADLEVKINDLEITLREDGLAMARRQARLDALKEGMSDQDEELVNLRESLATLQEDKVSMEGEVKFARQMLEKIGQAEENSAALDALRAESKEASALAEKAKRATFAIQDEYQELVELLEEKRKLLVEAEGKLAKVAKVREQLHVDLRAARSRLGALQRLQENYEGFAHGVKIAMTAADDGKLKGIVGVVASLLTPDQGLESAIEVALGGAMQNIVVETAQRGKDAIEFLKRGRGGRASFIPLDIIRPRANDKQFDRLIAMPGVVGWATDLVRFDPFIRPAVEFLLGNTIVVEQIDVALAMERKGFRTKYVTLDGDILQPGGLMTGGSHRASGLLSREGEIASLGEESESLARQLVEKEEHQDKLEAAAGRLRHDAAELEQKSTKLQVGLVAAVKDAEAADKAAKLAAEKLEKFEERHFAAEDERADYEDQIRFNGEALEDLATQLSELRKRADELSSQQGERGKRIDAAASEIQEMRLKTAADAEKLNGFRAALERVDGETSRDQETIGAKQAELDKLADDEERARGEIDALRKVLGQAEERFADAQARLKAQDEDKKGRAGELREMAERLQALQRDRNLLQNDLREAEIQKAQRESDLENIGAQAEEKFESSFDDIVAQLEAELAGLAEARAEAASERTQDDDARDGGANGYAAEIIDMGPMGGYGDDEGPFDGGDGEDSLDGEGAQPRSPEEMTERQQARWLQHPLACIPFEDLQAEARDLRADIESLGAVNMAAIEECEQIEERLAFIGGQKKDLDDAREAIVLTVAKIDETTARLFRDCFDSVRESFANLFRRLFGGGRADLVLTEPENIHETGVEIVAQPPGKKPQTISLLSGGEMCLTATALLFALFQWKPAPFCILDEIDAPLDDANVERFKTLIREFSDATQFIVISHNKLTMDLADSVFGVTMQEPGVSQIVSVRFDQVEENGLLRDAPNTAATHDTNAEPQEQAEVG